jgi:mannosylglycerate hydrolase
LAHISKIIDTPLKASFRIELVMQLPECYEPALEQRSQHLKDFPISSVVTLTQESQRVDIKTTIDNTVRDHRFRVLFSTQIQTDVSNAESIFDVAERSIKLPECRDWVEPQPMTTPQVCFADLSDAERGVAIINEGLKEYEAVDTQERPLALTLMRGFEMEGFTRALSKDPNPEVNHRQNLGVYTYRYAIYPHPGNWKEGEVFKEAYVFNSPLRAVQCGGGEGELPKSLSFMEIKPSKLVISAIKQAEEGNSLVVRFFNPTAETIKGTARLFRSLKGAKLLNLLEEPQEELNLEDEHTVRLEVSPKKIITVRLIV